MKPQDKQAPKEAPVKNNPAPEQDDKKPAPAKPTAKKPTTPVDVKAPAGKGGKTASGQEVSQIEVNPSIDLPLNPVLECVVAFGRFNPPTAGHDLVADAVLAESIQRSADARIYISHREDTDANPLPYTLKSSLAEAAFGDLYFKSDANDLFKMLAEVSEKYERVTVVAGDDRLAEWNRRIEAGNGRFFHFKEWTVVSAGTREGAVSGTQLREAVKTGDRGSFKKNISENLAFMADDIYDCIKSVYDTGDLSEALNMSQRMKRALQMKRHKGIIQTARKRALKRRANSATIAKRARRVAISLVRKRLLRNLKYKDATYGQRQRVDAIIAKRKKAIQRLTRKVVPRLRQAEARRAMGTVSRVDTKGLREENRAVYEAVTTAAPSVPLFTRNYLAGKAARSNIDEATLMYVYQRGMLSYELSEQNLTREQFAMNAVNSYIAGGLARKITSQELS